MAGRYTMSDWAVVSLGTPYTAPEARRIALRGVRRPGNKEVITTPVKSVSGRTVTTESGSVYILGTVSPQYSDFCRANGIPHNMGRPDIFAAAGKAELVEASTDVT